MATKAIHQHDIYAETPGSGEEVSISTALQHQSFSEFAGELARKSAAIDALTQQILAEGGDEEISPDLLAMLGAAAE